MRKQSMMGSSEFELEPRKFEDKIEKRNAYMNYGLREMQEKLDDLGLNYQKCGLGAIENFERNIIRELLKEWKKRYEN